MRFETKSKFNVKINSESTDQTNQTTEFADANAQWTYAVDSECDPTYSSTDNDGVSLQEFFSRPIKIATYSWDVDNLFFQSLRPWELFFENPKVLNRLVNYNLLRAKLHVRLMINGNSFYYGRMCASWLPLDTKDQFFNSRPSVPQDMIQESQRPHVYLNPTESKGGDLLLPFIWPSNALLIPQQQWREMGQMEIRSFGTLKHANGATDPVTVSVFAWAEDVHISIPTSNQPGSLSPQAGPDEYKQDGVISKPANTLSKLAAGMTNVPQIGPYALATSQIASAVGKIAGMHGFSKPADIRVPDAFTPEIFPNSVNVEGLDRTTKLTLDPKQELTVDPRTMGLGTTDEMSVKSIACRESFLTTFAWDKATAAESKLFGISVTPVLWDSATDPLSSVTEIHMPACAFAALPFRQWRGTMKFRFQVVCSAYHKGRLRIAYDPSVQLTNDYNTNYNYIVDISNENDFTVEVGWGSDRSMLNHAAPGDTPPLFGPNHNVSPSYSQNGMLSVYVVNELTVPNSTVNNDISINVFVSAGDDFEVFNPSAQFIENYSWFNQINPSPSIVAPLPIEKITEVPEEELDVQAGLDHPDQHETDDQDAPMMGDETTKLAPFRDVHQMSSVFYGDPIVSFRQCLKRYNFSRSQALLSTNRRWHKMTLPNFPFYRGYAPGAINITAFGLNYTYAKMSMMNYLSPAYVCRRGGVRVRYHIDGIPDYPGRLFMMQRLPFSSSGYSYTVQNISDSLVSLSALAREANLQIPNTWPGAAFTDVNKNPVLSGELPYYSNQRFSYSRYADVGTSADQQNVSNHFHQVTFTNGFSSGAGAMFPRMDMHYAAGDDFTLSMFVGCPRIFRISPAADPPPE